MIFSGRGGNRKLEPIKQWLIDEKNVIYKVNDILIDTSSSNFNTVQIVKFVVHHRRFYKKDIFVYVILKDMRFKTKKFTVPVEMLGSIYIKENSKNGK